MVEQYMEPEKYTGYALMSQNITTTCLICCRASTYHLNSSDPLRHGLHRTSEGTAVYAKILAADPLSPVNCKVKLLVVPPHPTYAGSD